MLFIYLMASKWHHGWRYKLTCSHHHFSLMSLLQFSCLRENVSANCLGLGVWAWAGFPWALLSLDADCPKLACYCLHIKSCCLGFAFADIGGCGWRTTTTTATRLTGLCWHQWAAGSLWLTAHRRLLTSSGLASAYCCSSGGLLLLHNRLA